MTRTLIATLAITLGLSGAAFAQATTGSGNTTTTAAGAPASWDSSIASAFLSATGDVKSESEMQSGWAGLTAEQQAEVRDHCQTMDTASGTSGADTSTPGSGSTTGNAGGTASGSTTTPGSGSGTTGSGNPASGGSMAQGGTSTSGTTSGGSGAATGSQAEFDQASVQKVCDFVKDL